MSAERKQTAQTTSDPAAETMGNAFHFTPGYSIGYLLRNAYRCFAKRLQTHIGNEGVGLGQWYFLRELWEDDGLSQRELSLRVGITEASTTVLIRGMIKDGLVRKELDPDDRRRKRIFLTERGHGLKDALLPGARDVNIAATKGFSKKEVKQLRTLVNRLTENLND